MRVHPTHCPRLRERGGTTDYVVKAVELEARHTISVPEPDEGNAEWWERSEREDSESWRDGTTLEWMNGVRKCDGQDGWRRWRWKTERDKMVEMGRRRRTGLSDGDEGMERWREEGRRRNGMPWNR